MLAIVPLGALALYLLLGYILARALFATSGLGFSICLACVVVAPFVADEVYGYQKVSEQSWICDTIDAEPVYLKNTDSTVVVIPRKISENTLPSRLKNARWLSPDTSVNEMLGKKFLALFAQPFGAGGLFMPALSKQNVGEICLPDEDQNSCGHRLLAKHSMVNIVATRPGHGMTRYWVWGNALGDENEVHHWTRVSILKGSFSSGGWPFWWPWTGRNVLKTCTSNNMDFETWLIAPET